MGPVQNDTDTMSDYFDTDSLCLLPGDPWYNEAKAVAVKSLVKDIKRRITWLESYLKNPTSAARRQASLDALHECERRLATLMA